MGRYGARQSCTPGVMPALLSAASRASTPAVTGRSGNWLVEVHPAGVEALAGRMDVARRLHVQPLGRGLKLRPRWRGAAAAGEAAAPGVGEDQPVGVIGVAADAQLVAVVEAMVAGTQRHQVGRVGGAAVLPVGDVV